MPVRRTGTTTPLRRLSCPNLGGGWRTTRRARDFMASPMSAGLFTTVTPAAARASIFSAAVPFPPEMIAPACPMRRPGRRGLAGDEAHDRLLEVVLDPRRGFLLGVAADLADHHDALGLRVVGERASSASMKYVPISGSPPIPMHVVWPSPCGVNWWMAS